MSTVGEAAKEIAEYYRGDEAFHAVKDALIDFIAVLRPCGADALTPLGNLVALREGQYVVEWAEPEPGTPVLMAWQGEVVSNPDPLEPYPWFIPGNGWRWVVVREAAPAERET